jgi:hypothetical protein
VSDAVKWLVGGVVALGILGVVVTTVLKVASSAWRRPKLVPRFTPDDHIAAETVTDSLGTTSRAQVVRLAIRNKRRWSASAQGVQVRILRFSEATTGAMIARPDAALAWTGLMSGDPATQNVPPGAARTVDVYWLHIPMGPAPPKNYAALKIVPQPVNQWFVLEAHDGRQYRLEGEITAENASPRRFTLLLTIDFRELGGGIEILRSWPRWTAASTASRPASSSGGSSPASSS